MKKSRNQLWQFFASVKLTLILLIILPLISIAGTVIQQNRPSSVYVEEYGATLARIFEGLGLTSMYSSWWFSALLGLFALNLVVCSIERLPGVWRAMTQNTMSVDVNQLTKTNLSYQADTALKPQPASARLCGILSERGWKNPKQIDNEGSILLFAQKGAWTRLGVYVVHLSILVILVGALLGNLFGYEAYVVIPEGRSTNQVFLQKDNTAVPLGFELRCEEFEKVYYPNGLVKQYRSVLAVSDFQGEQSIEKTVIVNDPLSYQGITFYIGDSSPLEEYYVLLKNSTTGQQQVYRIPPDRDVAWPQEGLSFRIEELRRDLEGAVTQARFKVKSAEAENLSSDFWVNHEGVINFSLSEEYTLAFKQHYSVLLLVTKDPGVLLVYLGSILMILGLIVSFFLSHRKIWVNIEPEGKQGSRITLIGVSNKNKPAFERQFQTLTDRLAKEQEFCALKTKT